MLLQRTGQVASQLEKMKDAAKAEAVAAKAEAAAAKAETVGAVSESAAAKAELVAAQRQAATQSASLRKLQSLADAASQVRHPLCQCHGLVNLMDYGCPIVKHPSQYYGLLHCCCNYRA